MRGTAAHPPWPEAFTAHTRRWCALLDYAEVAAILQPGNSQITAQEIELVTELAEFLRDFVSAAEVVSGIISAHIAAPAHIAATASIAVVARDALIADRSKIASSVDFSTTALQCP